MKTRITASAWGHTTWHQIFYYLTGSTLIFRYSTFITDPSTQISIITHQILKQVAGENSSNGVNVFRAV